MILLLQLTRGAVTKRKKFLKKFLYYFKNGFEDETYIAWERKYKEDAHLKFNEVLGKKNFSKLLKLKNYKAIVQYAVQIESRTNLLFSFEKMALRDAVKSEEAAKKFALGLFNYIYGSQALKERFEAFVEVVQKLPRKQTRVLTWPLVTVFGFIGNPNEFIFLKPRVTQMAALKYGFDFQYKSKPNWSTYKSMLDFAEQVRKDTISMKPKDNIDIQSFIWVTGSDEYED